MADKYSIIVKKPFVLSLEPTPGSRIPREIRFDAGTHDVPKEVFDHPYISQDFADGHIEKPEETKARIEASKVETETRTKADAKIMADAEAALKRAQGTTNVATSNDEATEKELNTPINQLQAKAGADIGQPKAKGF